MKETESQVLLSQLTITTLYKTKYFDKKINLARYIFENK